ncbi:MAG: lysophospholipid acyltransferase family protein [Microcystaceae cyanobacterium]
MSQQQDREPLTSLMLYRGLSWSVVRPLLQGYLRGRIYGVKQIPKHGPAIIVSNHASYFDPPLLSSAMSRPVAFMAKEELFQIPLLGQAISLYGAYPVKRGAGDRGAIRAAINALSKGWLVGIFLEGTRTKDGRIYEPKLGAALIASKAQVPLIPVSLWGTEKILRKGSSLPRSVPVTIRVGTPIQPPRSLKREELDQVTFQCQEAIHALHDQGR